MRIYVLLLYTKRTKKNKKIQMQKRKKIHIFSLFVLCLCLSYRTQKNREHKIEEKGVHNTPTDIHTRKSIDKNRKKPRNKKEEIVRLQQNNEPKVPSIIILLLHLITKQKILLFSIHARTIKE